MHNVATRIGVIVCVHNRISFLEDALRSIACQTRPVDEVIIVDDGSDDEQVRIELPGLAEKYGATLHRIENRGLAGARNSGRIAATTDYLVFFDDDDILGPRYIELTSRILDHRSEVDVAYTRAALFGLVNSTWDLPEFEARRLVLDNSVYAAAMVRARTFDAMGGYDEKFRHGREDHDLWLRIAAHGGKFAQDKSIQFFYRQTSGSMNRGFGARMTKMVETYAQLSRNSPEFTVQNIEVLWDEILTLRRRNRQLLRRFGWLDARLDTLYRVRRWIVECWPLRSRRESD